MNAFGGAALHPPFWQNETKAKAKPQNKNGSNKTRSLGKTKPKADAGALPHPQVPYRTARRTCPITEAAGAFTISVTSCASPSPVIGVISS